MKVSQELKDEFENLRSNLCATIWRAMNYVLNQKDEEYVELHKFLSSTVNQLQFAKWWAGEEEIEVEEELYYLKLPFSRNAYVNLDTYDGRVFPGSKMERDGCRTKFTAEEIENNEKLRQFEKFKKRVDDDD